jgi:hypothetical protein
VVFVACVEVELDNFEGAVVGGALPPVVAAALSAALSAAELDADALSVVLPLDVAALDCVVDD